MGGFGLRGQPIGLKYGAKSGTCFAIADYHKVIYKE